MGIVGTHPGSFRKSGKQRSCGIRKMEEYTEDWILTRDGEILRLAMLAPFGCPQGRQEDYPCRMVDLEEYTEHGRW